MAKRAQADYVLFPIFMPLPGTELRDVSEEEGIIEEGHFKDSHTMYTHPVAKTKYAERKEIKKFVRAIRNYQIKKYVLQGLGMRGPIFLLDLFVFLAYYRPKYGLSMDNAWRFTVNKHNLSRIGKT